MCQAALSRTRRQFRVGRQSSDCAQSGSPIWADEVAATSGLGRQTSAVPVVECATRPDQPAPNRRHIQVGTLAAIWLAMLTAESAGLALQVLTSIRTLFLCASARPQAQPGALAFC